MAQRRPSHHAGGRRRVTAHLLPGRAPAMRLISWNVNGRVTSLGQQSQALHQRCPDVVALQEILPTTVAHWREQLAQSGLPYSVDSFVLQSSPLGGIRRRQYGEILAI